MKNICRIGSIALGFLAMSGVLQAAPLKIAWPDWPDWPDWVAWVAWEIGMQKGWFKEAGVEVEFLWFDYVPSMDAYVAGKVEAVCMTNGDALVFIGTVFQLVLVVSKTARLLDPALLEAAQTLGTKPRQMITKVVLPGIAPNLYNDPRILLGRAWTWLVIAELIGVKSGLTGFIDTQGAFRNFDRVFPIIILIGVTGFVTDQLLAMLHGLFFPWAGKSGPLSLRLANSLVGNAEGAPGLEITLSGPMLRFEGAGARAYLAVAGGIESPLCLGSAATFTLGKFGGPFARALLPGDVLGIGAAKASPVHDPRAAIPLTHEWRIGVLYGPHGAPDFFLDDDIETFFATRWEVHYNSARTGVRLIGPKPKWARADGGEGGLHPSNLHDNAYAIGAVDFTGDMPVILGPDGPSLGGFVCPVVVVDAELWICAFTGWKGRGAISLPGAPFRCGTAGAKPPILTTPGCCGFSTNSGFIRLARRNCCACATMCRWGATSSELRSRSSASQITRSFSPPTRRRSPRSARPSRRPSWPSEGAGRLPGWPWTRRRGTCPPRTRW